MPNGNGGFASALLTFLSRSRGLHAAALLAVMGACSSSLGPGGAGGSGPGDAGGSGTGEAGSGGTTGTGGAAGCANRAPTDIPFQCKPTYAEQLTALCGPQPDVIGGTSRTAGVCESFQVTLLNTNFSSVMCFYDSIGALVGATRCETSSIYCGSQCIDSAGRPTLSSCFTGCDICAGSAGAGGSAGGSGPTGAGGSTGARSGCAAGTSGSAGAGDSAAN